MVHTIILWPKRYIIIPGTNEPSIPPRRPPSPGRSSAPGSSSLHARSPSPEPFNSEGASDDDDIPPKSPPKQPPATKQTPKRSRAQASKSMPPPIKKQPIKKKKPEPVRKKLPYELTKEENEIECRKQLDDWLAQVRQGSRQKEEARKKIVDPEELRFFIKMKEETRRKLVVKPKSDYDRSLCKSLKKKKRGGSPSSYTASDEAKQKQKVVSTSAPPSAYVASGLNAEERALATMPTKEVARVISFQQETGLPLEAILGTADPLAPDSNFVPRWPFNLGEPMVRPKLVISGT